VNTLLERLDALRSHHDAVEQAMMTAWTGESRCAERATVGGSYMVGDFALYGGGRRTATLGRRSAFDNAAYAFIGVSEDGTRHDLCFRVAQTWGLQEGC
jgi:hypothetical protein